jgi:hypothetical protein
MFRKERRNFAPVAVASIMQRPRLKALLFPLGAPGDSPLCIRQRPLGIDETGFMMISHLPTQSCRFGARTSSVL